MTWLDCKHPKIIEDDGHFYCDLCGLEFPPPDPPLCRCYIDFDGEKWVCQKCGTVYDEEYLRSAGWDI